MEARSQTHAPPLGAPEAQTALDGMSMTSLRLDARADRAAGIQYDPRWYGADYFKGYDERRAWYYPVAWTLRRHLRPRTALDLGCGLGLMVEAWSLEGVDAAGVDVSPAAIAAAGPLARGRVQQCNVVDEVLPFDDESMDLVTSIEVLEHLPDHENYLREVNRVLRPGGWLFIQTPKPGSREALSDPTHISVKSKREWVRMHEAAGFKSADETLLAWEHELPMTRLGTRLGWFRYTAPLKRYAITTGTRTLYRKVGGPIW